MWASGYGDVQAARLLIKNSNIVNIQEDEVAMCKL